MLVKINNDNTIAQFPYSERELRRDNPSVSFPRQIPIGVLNDFSAFIVTIDNKPEIDVATHRIVRNQFPTLISGNWILGWTSIALELDQIDSVISGFKHKVTKEANRRVDLIAGNSTDKLMSMMIAIDLLDIKNSRAWTPGERSSMVHLRNVKAAIRSIRIASATIKVSMESMTGAQLESVDISNHPNWP